MNFIRSFKSCAVVLLSSIFLITTPIYLPASAEENKAEMDAAAPDFDLQDVNGSHVTLSQFKGQKPVLLYFWATWCGYCMAVRPKVIELRKNTQDSDIAILAINVGSGDSLEKVKRFEEANPAPYTVLYDAGSKVAHSYKISGIPQFILLDKTGSVKYQGNQLPADPMSFVK